MSSPEYSMVMRDKRGSLPADGTMNVCVKFDGDIYDIGDLVDTGFKLPFNLNFGPNHYFCSAGAYVVRELMGVVDPRPTAKERIPPCNWANYPEYFTRVNGKNRPVSLPEPTRSKV